ncbi:MAG TPA: hypothetical protein VGN12_02040 [Pirellulales bacterium]|jgi:hypothetical protein
MATVLQAVQQTTAVMTTTMATAASRTTALRGSSRRAITAAAAATITGATTAATMTETGRSLVVGAYEGNADHREEHRDAEKQCTIHSDSSH